MATGALLAALVTVAACAPPPEVAGRRLFAANCTGCHGADGRGGTGPDLTRIVARAGGSYDLGAVMSHIDGYTRSRTGRTAMPEFGAALQEGALVWVDTGDGVRTPTPERLVQLAEYLRSIQEN